MNDKVVAGLIQPSLKFYDERTGNNMDSIWPNLEAGLWKDFNYDNYFINNTLGEKETSTLHPLFPDVQPIPPGYRWDVATRTLKADMFVPNRINATRDSLMSVAEKFFERFKDKKVGVHLSGGLDSSLIIALLHHFGIPCTLIGLQSKRYEFRTERVIQQRMGEYGEDVFLLDLDEYPFYSGLDESPKSQIPNGWIKMQNAHFALADEFAKRGVEVVFTGQGGDSIFVDTVPKDDSLPSFNIRDLFTFPEDEDFCYRPRGIELVSFYSDKDIITQIVNLRSGQKEDVWKLWARDFFKDLLPRELSQYHYCADFFGHSIYGLNAARNQIKELMVETCERTGRKEYYKKAVNSIDSIDFQSFGHKDYIRFCTMLSYAVWIHSLFRENS